MMGSRQCCVPGCAGNRARGLPGQIGEGLCALHFSLASPPSRTLLQSAARRLAGLQRSWENGATFDAVAARGRYLAFCAVLEAAHARVDRAWDRVRAEVLAALGDLDAGSPGVVPLAAAADQGLGAALRPLDGTRLPARAPQE
jgi:hypothetical protein